MNRDELHPTLRQEYQEGQPAGVTQVDHPLCKGMWFVVPPPPPRTAPRDLPLQALSKATDVLARQPRLAHATELDLLIAFLFLRKEAVESSRMEGTLSTIEHVLTPGEILDDWKAKSEGASVRGYAQALEEEIRRVTNEGVSIFTTDLVSRLHRETMALDPRFRGVPGRTREAGKPGEVVWIRGKTHRPEDSIYNPPPAIHVPRLLRETIAWFADQKFVEEGDSGLGMPLIVRMAIGHAHFEGIHPFSDGNGRVGRMLLTLQMACHGEVPIYLSGYIEEEKPEYSRVLQEAQKKLHYAPIVEFFSEALIASSREADRTRQAIEALPRTWKERSKPRKNSTSEKALDWLIAHPIFTAKQLQEKISVSAQAAHSAVDLLQKKGIARERTGYGRNRVFAAEEVIALLARRFGSDPGEALEGAKLLLTST